MKHHLLAGFIAVLFAATSAANAVENDTAPQLGVRAATVLNGGDTIDFTMNYRATEGFKSHDREIAEVRYARKFGDTDIVGAYHIEVDRRGILGNEHRLWEQVRHRFRLDSDNSIESSLRLEQRFFDVDDSHGNRLRWLARWVTPISPKDQFRLGYELLYNLDTISKSIQRGVSEDRLITGLQHILGDNDRIEFEWMARYRHIPGGPNRIMNQLSLLYTYNF